MAETSIQIFNTTSHNSKQIKSIADGVDPQDAAAFHQITDALNSINFLTPLMSYKAHANTNFNPPAPDGYVKWNNASQISATHLYISMMSEDNFDLDLVWSAAIVNNKIYLQDKSDSDNLQVWKITAVTAGSHILGYWDFEVTLVSSTGTGTTGFANNHILSVYLAQHGFSGDYNDLINKPTLGTAASKDTGTSSGQIPILDGSGLLNASVIPISFVNKITVGTEATRLTDAGQNLGDVYKCTDTGKSYMLQSVPSSTDANWTFFTDVTPDWSTITNKPTYTSTRILFGDGSTDASTSSNLIYSSSSLYIKNGGYLSGDADANCVDISYGRLRINGGTKVTGDAGASFKIKETWNDATMIGYTFVSNITDTASDVNSLLELKNVNSVPVYQLRKDGAISLGVNNATPWKNGVGPMEAMTAPSTAPSTAALTDSAIRWYDDTSKRYKYIDDTGTVFTIAATSDLSSYLTSSLTSAYIFVGNGTNVATGVALSGDATLDNTGALTIKTSVALAGSPTTTTQAEGDSSTKISTTEYAYRTVNRQRRGTDITGNVTLGTADLGYTRKIASGSGTISLTVSTLTGGVSSGDVATITILNVTSTDFTLTVTGTPKYINSAVAGSIKANTSVVIVVDSTDVVISGSAV